MLHKVQRQDENQLRESLSPEHYEYLLRVKIKSQKVLTLQVPVVEKFTF